MFGWGGVNMWEGRRARPPQSQGILRGGGKWVIPDGVEHTPCYAPVGPCPWPPAPPPGTEPWTRGTDASVYRGGGGEGRGGEGRNRRVCIQGEEVRGGASVERGREHILSSAWVHSEMRPNDCKIKEQPAACILPIAPCALPHAPSAMHISPCTTAMRRSPCAIRHALYAMQYGAVNWTRVAPITHSHIFTPVLHPSPPSYIFTPVCAVSPAAPASSSCPRPSGPPPAHSRAVPVHHGPAPAAAAATRHPLLPRGVVDSV